MSLRVGVPLSVTLTVTVLVLGPCASLGVQVISPLLPLIVIPPGADTSAKVSALAGTSASVAELVTVRVASSLIV